MGSNEPLICPACNGSIPLNQMFCGQCGAKALLTCSGCGAESPRGNRFCGSCGSALQDSGADDKVPQTREERRWATVLFADISGFTSMSEQMDPEDVKSIADQAVKCLSEQVHLFGGTIINVMGDAIMAVFGAPVAHGNDAERAVRAALAMLDIPLTGQPNQELGLHIGINTGEVMGGLMGPEDRRDYTVMGDTVNTASRLESAAPSGTILVGEETWRATKQIIRYKAVTEIFAKGKTNPVRSWEALGIIKDADRSKQASTLFLGRDEETGILHGIWSKTVRDSQPHLITVIAEPGVGKSRLLTEWEAGIQDNVLVCHGHCLPYGEVRGYRALAQLLRSACGISSDVKTDDVQKQLKQFVRKLSKEQSFEIEPDLLARHLSLLIGTDSDTETASIPDPKTINTSLRYFLEALARRTPLCLILEDIHWADQAFLSLIEFVIAHAHDAPLLIVTSARPELFNTKSDWGAGIRSHTSIDLKPLNEDTTRRLIRDLCKDTKTFELDIDSICRVTGGNPLFVEEFVASIREKRVETTMPSSIRALISSRLDMLPPDERKLLQVASVVGEMFWPSAVETLGGFPADREILERLVQREFIRRTAQSQVSGQQQYEFKHALVRDVAYGILPRRERRTLHASLITWMEQTLGSQISENYDLLAYHALEAQQKGRALDYLVRAGDRARRAAAHGEAASLYTRAIAIANETGGSERLSELHTLCGRAYIAVSQWSEARPELERALELLPADSIEQRAEIMIDLATVHFWTFDLPTQRQYATQVLELSRELNRPDLEAAAIGSLGLADSATGDIQSSMERFQEIIRKCGSKRTDIPVSALEIYGTELYWTCKLDEAIKWSKEVLEVARATGRSATVMMVLPQLGLSLAGLGRYQEALDAFQEARRFGKEYGIDNLLARAISMSSGMHLELYDYTGARRLAEEARDMAHSLNFLPPLISASIDLLFVNIRTGELGAAEEIIDKVIASVEQASGWHAWLWKMRLSTARAELALARKDWKVAVQHAEDALARSRTTGRVKYEALALQSKAHALALDGRKGEAIPLMQSALDLLRPLNTPDLLFRAATNFLAVEGNDTVLEEARKTADRIIQGLPTSDIAAAFIQSQPYKMLR